jgi:GH15 family glucan-1,4-alpha-glucosidase
MTHRAPPISGHRLLSDGRSTALVRPDGEIDWWCWPRMDSMPVCWSLLDPDGGSLHFPDAVHAARDEDPAGPATTTCLRIGDQLVECRDALLNRGDTTDLVRLVRATESDLDVRHVARLGGFDGVAADPTLRVSGGDATEHDGTVETRLRAPAGSWVALVVTSHATDQPVDDVIARIDNATRRHEELLRTARFPAANVARARDALAVLHACTDLETGAVIASPTTSLPEVVGGDRQFDYRYSWLRDASIAISVASMLGQRDLADRYTDYLETLGPDGILRSPMSTTAGREVPDEVECRSIAGWNGSRPVRTGNSAGSQVQLDAVGMVLDAIAVHTRWFERLDAKRWEIVRALADRVADADPDEPTSGIWELRTPEPLVSADIGRWLALERALGLARFRRPLASRRIWTRSRDDARARVLGAFRPDGSLPQTYGHDHIDASALLLVIHRLLSPRDPRAHRLVDATISALGCGPLLYRYPPDGKDGFSAGEAPFVPASWWAVSALAVLGREAEAAARADALCALLPRLQSEEFDPTRGEALGNTPLVWSHAEAARALYELDLCRSWPRPLPRRHAPG